jgi:hypothetical protein
VIEMDSILKWFSYSGAKHSPERKNKENITILFSKRAFDFPGSLLGIQFLCSQKYFSLGKLDENLMKTSGCANTCERLTLGTLF